MCRQRAPACAVQRGGRTVFRKPVRRRVSNILQNSETGPIELFEYSNEKFVLSSNNFSKTPGQKNQVTASTGTFSGFEYLRILAVSMEC